MLPQQTSTRSTGGPYRRPIRYRRICFTVNGTPEYLDTAAAALKTLTPKWLIFGRETCPTTQRKHLQGACVFGTQVSLAQIKKMPGLEKAHIEVMRGSPHDSLVYCSKEDPEYYEYGCSPTPGKRNDLHDTIAELKKGRSIKDIVFDENVNFAATYCRFPKGLSNISHLLRSTQEREPPFVLWLYGSTGTGKTRGGHELAQHLGCSDSLWITNSSLQWFDGYDGDTVALLDDYRTGHCKFPFLLRLLDRYVLDVPFKGGFVRWVPKLIIVTAPREPRSMWDLRCDEDLKQLERRITLTFNCDGYEDYSTLYSKLFSTFVEACNSGSFTNLEQLLGGSGTKPDASHDANSTGDDRPDLSGDIGKDHSVSLSLEISSSECSGSGSDATVSFPKNNVVITSTNGESDLAFFLP